MATTATPELRPPQIQLVNPWAPRLAAVVITAGILLAVGLAAAIVLNDGGENTGSSGAVNQANAAAVLPGDAVESLPGANAVPFAIPTSNVPPYVAEHEAGVGAALFAYGESLNIAPFEVNTYVVEHEMGIDAVLGYELSEDVGTAAYIEEHDRLIDAVLGGS